jgi:hypothetical protein
MLSVALSRLPQSRILDSLTIGDYDASMDEPFNVLIVAAALSFVALPFAGWAKPGVQAAVVQGPLPNDKVCQAAIQSAEKALRLPTQLLGAIGLVESGRVIPPTGRIAPWPWTINVGGTGYFYDTKDQAVVATQGFLAKGVQSIDVGCLQVNLSFHPTAFASLDQAFDPVVNANYAAGFLTQLYAQSHLWATAAAAYHSQTPGVSDVYVRRVVAAWPMAVHYIDTSVLSAITSGAGVSTSTMRTDSSSTCVQPDLSRYTTEFRKVIIQASLDHIRLLTEMGEADRSKAASGCKMQPVSTQTKLLPTQTKWLSRCGKQTFGLAPPTGRRPNRLMPSVPC